MEIAVLGIDLGKNSCSVVGLDGTGQVVMRRRMQRDSVIKLASSMAPCVVAMEACCGAHHLGRIVRDQGHQERLMSPEHVRPYVKAQKNDDRDAEAIAEAATRPTMRFVELKSAEQLDMQSLHRVRDRLVGERTALINQLRAVLLERGITVPQGRRKLEQHLAVILDGEDVRLSPRVRLLVGDMRAEWGALDRRIAAFDDEFAAQAKTDDAARRLASIPGIGVLNATALAAAVGNAASFARARSRCLARPGATADDDRRKATADGDQQTWQQIPAQAAGAWRSGGVTFAVGKHDTAGKWLRNLLQRAHKNTVIVALANKLARIVWAVLRHGGTYDAGALTVA